MDHGKVRTQLLPAKSLGVGVEAEEDTLVAERVLVLRPRALLDFGVGRANDRLDLSAVDETGDVGVGNLRGREPEHIVQFRKARIQEEGSRTHSPSCRSPPSRRCRKPHQVG